MPQVDLNEVDLIRFPNLQLKPDTPKGRGVFATTPIPKGTIIDTSPVLLLDPEENERHIEHTTLYHYTYNWPLPSNGSDTPLRKMTKTQAVVLGLGSMFNHSRNQNVAWTRDLDRQVIVYSALRDVEAGEELCISYGDRLTFQDADVSDHEDEKAEEVLGRIELEPQKP